MTSVSTDRRQGVNSSNAIKTPCKAATSANITLSGEQTIDGVALVTGNRCLVWNQTDPTENGIYNVDTGTWTRALDFNGAYDVVDGTLVYVNSGGTQYGGSWFVVSTDDPITIETSSINFARQNINNVTKTSIVATAGQTVFNVGTYQIGANGAQVFVDGLRVRLTDDYTESSSTQITFTYALQAGQQVDVYTGQSVGNLTAAAASAVTVSDAGDYWVGTTVEAVLQEISMAITLDVGDADATLTNASSNRIQRWNTPLTANRTATLSTTSAKEGAGFVIVRGAGATGNYDLLVGSLATLKAPGQWCEVRYDLGSAAWVLVKHGFLPSATQPYVGTDVGNADATLTAGSSAEVQQWATTLTADRAATLSATGAWTGAKFRVVRAEAATGNFALTVQTASAVLLRLAPGQWADFAFNGTTWLLVGFGDLRPGLTAYNVLRDDFTGNEIDGARWQSAQGTDASCQGAIAYPSQPGGLIRMTTGADAGATMALNGSQLQSDLNWKANKGGLFCEFRLQIDAITAVALFVGLTDQIDTLEMPFTMAAGDILTSNASDACGVLYDTAADTDNWWLVGVAADIDATKQNSALAPVASTFETWRIELSAVGAASFYRNNTLIGTVMTGACTPSVGLTPCVAAFSRGATSRNIDIDEIIVQQQR